MNNEAQKAIIALLLIAFCALSVASPPKPVVKRGQVWGYSPESVFTRYWCMDSVLRVRNGSVTFKCLYLPSTVNTLPMKEFLNGAHRLRR